MLRDCEVGAQGDGGEDGFYEGGVGGFEEGFVGRGVDGLEGGLQVEPGVVEEILDGAGLGAAGVDEVVAAGDPVVYGALSPRDIGWSMSSLGGG